MARQVKADIKLWNIEDEVLARKGYINIDQIRKIEVKDVIVDTGTVYLVLPQYIVDQLRLHVDGEVIVTYANKHKARKKVARGVRVEVLNRRGTFDAIIGDGELILIGMLVLEGLDLWPDTKTGKLTYNPEAPDNLPFFPILKIAKF